MNKYINLDDCWSTKERDSNDLLVPDSSRFPSGLNALTSCTRSEYLLFGFPHTSRHLFHPRTTLVTYYRHRIRVTQIEQGDQGLTTVSHVTCILSGGPDHLSVLDLLAT